MLNFTNNMSNSTQEYMLDLNPDDGLILALKHSHEQALAGDTFTMEEVDQFMKEKIYELTHRVDTYSVAESL